MNEPVHTVDEALARFKLIEGKGNGTNTACVMSAVSWMAGESFTDSPQCAHPTLTSIAIQANDADGTTPEQRAEILRAGATGLIGTWDIPGVVIACAIARPKVPEGEDLSDEPPVERALRVLAFISEWKEHRSRPGSADLSSADLSSADLRSANLRSADLSSANLSSADLSSADLSSANLSSADLSSADLSSANLRSANLRSANLSSANLRSANLRSANLRSANLRSADLRWADLRSADLSSADLRSANLRSANLSWAWSLAGARGDRWTRLPSGWRVDEATGLIVADAEVAAPETDSNQ